MSIYTSINVLSSGGGWLTGRGWSVTRARKTRMFCSALCVVPIAFVTRVGDWPAVVLATGALLDHYANGYALAFGFCSVVYLLAFGVNHWLAPRFENA